MLNNIKVLTKDTLVYSLGNASTKVIGLILLPIYTDKLSVAEYGVLGTVEITIQLLVAAFSFSLQQALSRWYWDIQYRDRQKSIFFSTNIALIVASLLMVLIFLPFSNTLSLFLLDSTEYSYLFKILFVSAALQIFSRNILIVMRLQRKSLLFTSTNILKLIVTLGVTIYFILVLKKGVEGIIEAQIIGFLFFILINLKFILKNIEPTFEMNILKEMLCFSYPLAISSLGAILITVTDRYSIRYISGMEDMGLYQLAFKITNVLKIFVINSAFLAIDPMRYKMIGKPNNKRFYSKIMTYTTYGVIFFLLIIVLFSQEAIKLLAQNPKYWNVYIIVPFLCYAQLFELFRKNTNFGLIIMKKTKIMSFVMIFATLLNVVLNIFFISYFRIMGAAIASLLAQVVFFLIIYRFAQRYYYIPYEMKKVVLMLIVSIGIIILSYLFINPMHLLPRVIIKLLLIAAFPFVLYPLRFYESVELYRIKGAYQKWKNPKKWKDNISNIKIG